ncbi:MAG: NPCBM/NEW2 domain-containing protein [Syntrophomonadaceae bacterium]|nr:NPCBM/NEW2 domain-containing protein [Syntrophomonadaceae bacterium]
MTSEEKEKWKGERKEEERKLNKYRSESREIIGDLEDMLCGFFGVQLVELKQDTLYDFLSNGHTDKAPAENMNTGTNFKTLNERAQKISQVYRILPKSEKQAFGLKLTEKCLTLFPVGSDDSKKKAYDAYLEFKIKEQIFMAFKSQARIKKLSDSTRSEIINEYSRWYFSKKDAECFFNECYEVYGPGTSPPPPSPSPPPPPSPKNRNLAGWLAIFLGMLGGHDFYLGDYRLGVLRILIIFFIAIFSILGFVSGNWLLIIYCILFAWPFIQGIMLLGCIGSYGRGDRHGYNFQHDGRTRKQWIILLLGAFILVLRERDSVFSLLDDVFAVADKNNEEPAEAPVIRFPLVAENHTFTDGYTSYIVWENGQAQKYIGFTNSGLALQEVYVSDVKSVYNLHGRSFFFIKNDNTLWACGDNEHGQLGDNTGVNKEEPVKIMDDVADIYSYGYSVFAVMTNRTLWAWGEGQNNAFWTNSNGVAYAPVKIGEDVIQLPYLKWMLDSNGDLWTWSGDAKAPYIFTTSALRDFSIAEVSKNRKYHAILENDTLCVLSEKGKIISQVLDDVLSIDAYGKSVFAIKNDHSLWAYGVNTDGRLGDGTKIDRDAPVKIMDGVSKVYDYALLKTDGTFWAWDTDDPTPKQVLDGVAEYYRFSEQFWLKTDGTLWCLRSGKYIQLAQGVKLPSKTTVPDIIVNAGQPVFIKDLIELEKQSGIESFAFYEDEAECTDNRGNKYSYAYGGNNSDGRTSWEYAVDADYNLINGTVFFPGSSPYAAGQDVRLRIYGDGELIYTSPEMTAESDPADFSVDISGVKNLRLEIVGVYALRLTDCVLY